MKRERVQRRLHMFWHKLILLFCIEYNENWKKIENRAQASVTCTKSRLTDTKKGHCSKSSGMSMERVTVEAMYRIYSPPSTRRALL